MTLIKLPKEKPPRSREGREDDSTKLVEVRREEFRIGVETTSARCIQSGGRTSRREGRLSSTLRLRPEGGALYGSPLPPALHFAFRKSADLPPNSKKGRAISNVEK